MELATRRGRNPAIDAARGFAALYVAVLHLYHELSWPLIVDRLIDHGRTAVPLFFILSGYLLFQSLERRAHSGKNWRAGFYIHRAFRILPLYWGLLLLLYLCGHGTFGNLIWNMFFLFGFFYSDLTQILIYPAWSLIVEEVYYLILPLIFLKVRESVKVNVFLCALFYLIAHYWLVHAAEMGFDHQHYLIGHHVLANIHFLFIGLGIAVFLEKFPLFRLKNSWKGMLLVVYLLPLFFEPFPLEVACAALALVVILEGKNNSHFKLPVLQYLGVRCYGIYLIHFPLVIAVGEWLRGKGVQGRTFLILHGLLAIGGALFLAEVSWRFWERPWQKLGRRVWPV